MCIFCHSVPNTHSPLLHVLKGAGTMGPWVKLYVIIRGGPFDSCGRLCFFGKKKIVQQIIEINCLKILCGKSN